MQAEKLSGVAVDYDGAPVAFDWRGGHYLAASRPVRWYSRRLWWQEASGAPRGSGAMLVETEMWRLWAASEGSRSLFELRHQMPEDAWEIYPIDS